MTDSKTIKKLVIIIFVSFFSLVLFADAEIKFKQKEVDFGEVESGSSVDLKFEFSKFIITFIYLTF